MDATLEDVARKTKREPIAEEKIAEELVRRPGSRAAASDSEDIFITRDGEGRGTVRLPSSAVA